LTASISVSLYFSFFDEWELGVPEMESYLIEHCQRFKDNGCIRDCHIYTPSEWKKMQLENIVPQSEGDYERRVFVEEGEAIAWMKMNEFSIETKAFFKQLT
jgi:hypothetical protein